MNFKKPKSQSGRSMVEMLGVLAIIGVLSVGGIAGYSLSMRRHRANGIVDIASKFALVAYGRCQQKIMDGEAENAGECESYIVRFNNAGVGSEPAGLRSPMWIPGFTTDANTGVDTVRVTIPLEDTKLCQAIASIAGASCDSGNFVDIDFKQN